MPSRCAVPITRQAISPRLAIRILENMFYHGGTEAMEQRNGPLRVLRAAVVDRGPPAAHIRKTPKRVGASGALRLAEIASARTIRVSAGSMMPSSHNRALAWYGWPWVSYWARIGALNASS